MSLTRYAPQILESFRLVAARPALAAGIAVPGLALVVGGQALAGAGGLQPMGLGLSALAASGMGYLWQRGLATGASSSPVQLVLRFVLWTLALNVLQGFELAPTILFSILLGDMPNAELYTRTGVQRLQLLIGGLFLLLPQLARGTWAELKSTKLQEMVLAGGMAVGLGYVVISLPFTVASEIARALFADFAPQADTSTIAMVGQSIHALNVFVVSGYFALVWMELKDLPSRLNPPAEADDAAEPKVRRTTRVNRLSKAKR